MKEVNKEPFIHLFSCSTGYYLYDVNTDSILKVTPDTYQRLEKRENIEENEQIRKIKEIWVLKNFTCPNIRAPGHETFAIAVRK